MLRVGLPKGGLKGKSNTLMQKMIGTGNAENSLSCFSDDYSFYFCKHRDVPRLILDGKLDIGITSTEWIEECDKKDELLILKELEWCNSRISFITSEVCDPIICNISCVTEFPRIAERYLNQKYGEYELYIVTGSCEGFVPTIFNCCIDCVETGKTIMENKLNERDVILKSKVLLVSRNDIVIDSKIERLINTSMEIV